MKFWIFLAAALNFFGAGSTEAFAQATVSTPTNNQNFNQGDPIIVSGTKTSNVDGLTITEDVSNLFYSWNSVPPNGWTTQTGYPPYTVHSSMHAPSQSGSFTITVKSYDKMGRVRSNTAVPITVN
jgi:hypothetical protein